MKPIYFILTIFLALPSLAQASFDGDDTASRSSRSSGSLSTSEDFQKFQDGIHSVAGYASLVQRVEAGREDIDPAPFDRRAMSAFKAFQKALPARLYETLPLVFFEEMGKSVAQMWVKERIFSFDILKIWEALVLSAEPEVVQFLKMHPIQEEGRLYVYTPKDRSLPETRARGIPMELEGKIATHFPYSYVSVR